MGKQKIIRSKSQIKNLVMEGGFEPKQSGCGVPSFNAHIEAQSLSAGFLILNSCQ